MAAPDPIENGDWPDADRLMEWLNYLAAGKAVKVATKAALVAAAQADPTTPFDCFATDTVERLFYTGNTSYGDQGFVVLG